MSAQLKQLSATYHVPVLVINQVTDFFAGADANGGEGLRIEQVKHSSVTSRMWSSRHDGPQDLCSSEFWFVFRLLLFSAAIFIIGA